MKIIRYNRQEFEACLVKGHDWKSRCEIVGSAVEEILEDSPNKIHRAGDLTSAILKAYGILGDRSNPLYRVVSKNITAIGKLPENKKFISLGKEIRCGNKPDGSARYARERLWKVEDAAPLTDKEHAEGSRDLAPAEASAQPEHKSPEDYMAIALKSIEILREHGFTVIYPGETVQGVDNSNVSKHPSPGAARVDCGQCGGSGKVYMKQEPSP